MLLLVSLVGRREPVEFDWILMSTLTKRFDCLWSEFRSAYSKRESFLASTMNQDLPKLILIVFHKLIHGNHADNWESN